VIGDVVASAQGSMANLFAYGTLIFPAIWRRGVGREWPSQSASVSGYAVYRVADGVYPVMVEAGPLAVVSGLVYRDVDAATLHLLDEYESDLYDRVEVRAKLSNGEFLNCSAYVLEKRNRGHASSEPWSAEAFERDHIARYLVRLH
jgi:gamma-glutamylcyclotransferase (GGCT)/AIG2-like uncharacterized protein YtfP